MTLQNRILNGNFSVNQRGTPNGPAVYRPGEFVRDCWRAGPSGCTLAFVVAANGDTVVLIGAGSILQIIEGEVYLTEGGVYILSWEGDAVGRAYTANTTVGYGASPVVVNGNTVGCSVIVEFATVQGGIPATLGLVQFDRGNRAPTFEPRHDELQRCRRYFHRMVEPPLRGVMHTSVIAARCGAVISPPMRCNPIVSLSGSLSVFDGTALASATGIAANYSTAEVLDVDLWLASALTVGRPAVVYVRGNGGYLDISAETSGV